MSIRYKLDVLAALKAAGFSTYRIRKEKLMGESTLQNIRDNKPISWDQMDMLCHLLGLQPGDILEYVPDERYGKRSV